MNVFLFILAILASAFLGFVIGNLRMGGVRTEAKMLRDDNRKISAELEKTRQETERIQSENTMLVAKREVLAAKVLSAENQLEEMKAQFQKQIAQMQELHEKMTEKQSELIQQQFNTVSEQILKRRAEELSDTNQQQMMTILGPLRENLKQMREAVEKSDRQHSVTIERLDASIRENMKQAERVGERADKLAQALMSENKTQGNFGELRLRTLLENMGMENGVQFDEQVTMREHTGKTVLDENGKRLQPDVILHFPDHRDVIIDSKISLKAFEEYVNSPGETEKEIALQRHLESVKSHVRELSKKNYSNYLQSSNNKLDFVLMYVFSESALQTALSADTSLWKWAYEHGVVITGSQNLFMILKVLELSWRQLRQAENQEAIMKAADEIINRVQLFYERFVLVEEQLDKTREAFDELKRSTASEGKSVITSARKLIDYGAKENPKRKLQLPDNQ